MFPLPIRVFWAVIKFWYPVVQHHSCYVGEPKTTHTNIHCSGTRNNKCTSSQIHFFRQRDDIVLRKKIIRCEHMFVDIEYLVWLLHLQWVVLYANFQLCRLSVLSNVQLVWQHLWINPRIYYNDKTGWNLNATLRCLDSNTLIKHTDVLYDEQRCKIIFLNLLYH